MNIEELRKKSWEILVHARRKALHEAYFNTPIAPPPVTPTIAAAGAASSGSGFTLGPTITSLPVIEGIFEVGNILTVAYELTGVPEPELAWQWQRSDDGISDWVDIPGAAEEEYVLTINDIQKYVRVTLTASNLLGTASAISLSSDIITQVFAIIINTSNISSGSSTDTQFRLPLVSSGLINFAIDWGDGTSDTITSFNQSQVTHTYPSSGTYTIRITGIVRGWRFAGGGDRLKILNIRSWGEFNMTNDRTFFNCTNLTCTAKDAPIISTTSLFLCFEGCPNFNGEIGNWDVKDVTNMASMFKIASGTGKFNQYIGNWDTAKVTTMNQMFAGQREFNQDISTKEVTVNSVTYTAWNTSNVVDMTSMFLNNTGNRGQFNHYIGNWNTSKVTLMNSMFQSQTEFNQDISTKEVTVGSITYTAWDTLNVTSMSGIFNIASPNEGKFNQYIGNWNTSKVTNMQTMFSRQGEFNQDISTKVVTVGDNTYTAWDTSNVTNMSFMLNFFTSIGSFGKFNQNIGNWNTSKVTTIVQLLAGHSEFNQDISTKVVTVGDNTYTAWDTSNVTNMLGVFAGTSLENIGVFNQNIGNWNTSKVTNMGSMLQRQTEFNQDISTKVVTVGDNTYTAWDTSNVTNMSFLFYHPSPFIGKFNQNIGNWNTSKVTNMAGIFERQVSFNQPLNSWDTSKVTNMSDMFYTATSFNQLIDNWDISLVTAFTDNSPDGFMGGKTFEDYSSANYDALLIGWSSRPVQPNLSINFGTIKRTSASDAAVAILTSAPNNWTIIDGGQI